MANFCIPNQIADKFKEAFASDKDLSDFYKAGTDGRRAILDDIVGKDLSQDVNTLFEKAMVSKQQDALSNWAKETFSYKNKAATERMLDKVKQMKNSEVLNPDGSKQFLRDLASTKLGIDVTEEQASKITELAKPLQEAWDKLSEDRTNPQSRYNYLKVRHDMENYMDKVTPPSKFKQMFSLVGRGNMIFNVSSTLLHGFSETVEGTFQTIVRRIMSRQVMGGDDLNFHVGLVGDYMKNEMKTFKDTGYNTWQMTSLDMGRNIGGESVTRATGEGAVGKIAKVHEDVVFKGAHGYVDTALGTFAFGDSAALRSTAQAKTEGLTGDAMKARAADLFKKSQDITLDISQPKTPEAHIRALAVADAMRSTFRDDTAYNRFSMGVRRLINSATGNVGVGEAVEPFVKTIANFVGKSFERAGAGGAKALVNLAVGLTKGDLEERLPSMIQGLVEMGVSLVGATVIIAALKPTDYAGAYPRDPKEQELWKIQNKQPYSVQFNNSGKWISLHYFAGYAATIAGYMAYRQAKAQGQSGGLGYVKAQMDFLTQLPGLQEGYNMFNYFESQGWNKVLTPQSLEETGQSIVTGVASRVIPSIVGQVAKSTDNTLRQTKDQGVLAGVKNMLPHERETLPAKTDVFGNSQKPESILSTILFSTRVATEKEDNVTKELQRMETTQDPANPGKSYLPAISELSDGRAATLKSQISPERYDQFLQDFGTAFKDRVSNRIESPVYKHMTIDRKAANLNAIKESVLSQTLHQYGYKKPAKIKVTTY